MPQLTIEVWVGLVTISLLILLLFYKFVKYIFNSFSWERHYNARQQEMRLKINTLQDHLSLAKLDSKGKLPYYFVLYDDCIWMDVNGLSVKIVPKGGKLIIETRD